MKRWSICLAIDARGNWSIHVYLLVGRAFYRLRSDSANAPYDSNLRTPPELLDDFLINAQTQAHNNQVFKRPRAQEHLLVNSML